LKKALVFLKKKDYLNNLYMLRNKKILFLGPMIYEYYLHIIDEMENKGANVIFFPVKRKNILTTILQNISVSLYELYQNRYRKNILKKTEHISFDYIFVIEPYLLSIKFFEKLKIQNKTSFFINYNWDSTVDYPILNYVHFFDKVFTFEQNDVLKYKMNYLPLFFIRKYEQIAKNKKHNKTIDVLFIGGYKKERYDFLQLIESKLKEEGFSVLFYVQMSFNRYLKYILKGKIIKHIKIKTLNSNKVAFLMSKSRCMIDYPKVTQTGLTMRTFETLGSGLKLITTNKTILNEQLLQDNILVVSPKNPLISNEFIKTKFKTDKLIQKYSLSNWILEIFKD